MKKNRGIQKLLALLMLSVVTISQVAFYQGIAQREGYYYIQVESQKKSNGLDVGKAD